MPDEMGRQKPALYYKLHEAIQDNTKERGHNRMRIKTCPHCCGTASLSANYSYKIRSWFVFVKCDICYSQGKIYRSNMDPEEAEWDNQPCRDAISAWNMRNGIPYESNNCPR